MRLIRTPAAIVCWPVLAFLLSVPARTQPISDYAEDFLSTTFNVETLWEPAVSAAWSNYVTRPAGFGTGASGFALHYGVATADNVNGKFMRTFAFAAASRRRDVYQPIGSGSIWGRGWHAVVYTFLAPERTFNWSGLPASLAAAGLSNVYQPAEQRTWLATFERAGTGTLGYMLGNVWLEFTQRAISHRTRLRKVVKSQ